MSYHAAESSKPKVLLLAPTAVAAINLDGTTIHSGLKIAVGRFGKNIPQLSDKLRSSLRTNLSEVQVVIIDEVSMVSNILLLYINQRLVKIFGCNSNIPFADLTVVFCRDFFQLPPIQAIYSDYNDEWQNLVHLWKRF